jgi:hypothetical protein
MKLIIKLEGMPVVDGTTPITLNLEKSTVELEAPLCDYALTEISRLIRETANAVLVHGNEHGDCGRCPVCNEEVEL